MNACQTAVQTTQGYTEDFIALIEMVYGEGFLAQGGTDTIDEMFCGIDLEGLKILDIGSGLGGPAFYLARHHHVDITGIDPHAGMVQKAKQNLEKVREGLKGKIVFSIMEDPSHLKQFPDNAFDLIFSKEAILHVPLECKEPFLKEIYRVLQSEGTIVIKDWMHSSPHYSYNTKKMMEMDGIALNLQTHSEYQNALEKVGFKKIQFTDSTLQHARISQQNIDTILKLANKLKERFGQQTLDYSLESWALQRDAFQTYELMMGFFRAHKM
jgi:phosphoethanolamine N-methyltransferase